MTQGSFSREIRATARLAGPLIGGQLTMVGMNFTDTVMAGRLDAAALAAVAVGSSVWASIMLFSTGVLMVLAPSVAQAEGAGERRRVAPLTRQTFWVSLALAVLGVLVAANLRPVLELLRVDPAIVPDAAGYLRALCWGVPAWAVYMVLRSMSEGLGATRPTLYFGLVGLAVNVPADWVLMYGKLGLPALGADGLRLRHRRRLVVPARWAWRSTSRGTPATAIWACSPGSSRRAARRSAASCGSACRWASCG